MFNRTAIPQPQREKLFLHLAASPQTMKISLFPFVRRRLSLPALQKRHLTKASGKAAHKTLRAVGLGFCVLQASQ